jgi:hypothetical protein
MTPFGTIAQSMMDEIPTEKELAHLLREARCYVSDAGCDEDPETQRNSMALLAKIDAALERASKA